MFRCFYKRKDTLFPVGGNYRRLSRRFGSAQSFEARMGNSMTVKEGGWPNTWKGKIPCSNREWWIVTSSTLLNQWVNSNILGYFPTIIHRLTPYINLMISQKSASSLLDLIWLENILPKTTSLIQTKISIIVTNQKGLIKLYFVSFLVTMWVMDC